MSSRVRLHLLPDHYLSTVEPCSNARKVSQTCVFCAETLHLQPAQRHSTSIHSWPHEPPPSNRSLMITSLHPLRSLSFASLWRPGPQLTPDTAYIYVGGLHPDLSEGDVITIFSQWGEIADINMPRDKETGESRGFGFVMYMDQRSTVLAVDNMSGAEVLGRKLKVDHARYKQPGKRNEDGDYEKPQEAEYNALPPLMSGESTYSLPPPLPSSFLSVLLLHPPSPLSTFHPLLLSPSSSFPVGARWRKPADTRLRARIRRRGQAQGRRRPRRGRSDDRLPARGTAQDGPRRGQGEVQGREAETEGGARSPPRQEGGEDGAQDEGVGEGGPR